MNAAEWQTNLVEPMAQTSFSTNAAALTFWRACQAQDGLLLKTFLREYTDDNPVFWDNFISLLDQRQLLCKILPDELALEVEFTRLCRASHPQ